MKTENVLNNNTDIFSSTYSINLIDNIYTAHLQNPKLCADIEVHGDWNTVIYKFANEIITSDYKELFISSVNTKEIKRRLSEESSIYSFEFEVEIENTKAWRRCCVMSTSCDENKNPLTCMILMEDISDKKKAVEYYDEWKKAKEILEFSVSGADIFLWQYDLVKDEITFADNTYTIKRKKEIGYPDVVKNASKYIMANVMPESIDDMKRVFDDIKEGKTYTSADIHFRAGGDKGYTVCRVSYRVVCDENGNPIKAYGSEQNITDRTILRDSFINEIARYENDDEKNIFKSRISLTKNKILAVYPAKYDAFLQYSYDDIMEKDGSYNESAINVNIFRDFLKRGDAIANYAKGDRNSKFDFMCYIDDDWKYIEAECNLVQNPGTSDVELFVYCRDITKQKLQNMVVNNLTSVIYGDIIVVNAVTDKCIMATAYGNLILDDVPYEEIIEKAVLNYVVVEEIEESKRLLSIDNIKKNLETQKIYTVNTREVDKDGHEKYNMRQFVWLDEHKELILGCNSDITPTIILQKELQNDLKIANKKLIQEMAMLRSFKNIFEQSIFINLKNKTVKQIEVTQKYREIINDSKGHLANFTDDFARNIVMDKYKELTYDFLNFDNVEKRFENSGAYVYEFEGKNNKWYRSYLIPVSRNSEGKIENLIFAVQEIDVEKRRIEKLNKQIEKDSAILQQASLDAYDFISVTDLKTKITELRSGSWFTSKVPTTNDMRVLPYDELIKYVGDNYMISADNTEKYYDRFSLDNIVKEVDKNGVCLFAFAFRDVENKERQKYKQFRFAYLDDKKDKLLASRTDITSSIEKEKALNNNMKDALLAAENANAAKSDFLSRMSHDIRTPMNAIIGFTTLIQKNIDDKEKIIDQTDKILLSGNHLLGLINDILDMSKIESGNVQINTREVDIKKSISIIEDMIRPFMEDKGQKFTVDMTGVKNKRYIADDQRMQQILINILSNAMKYTERGGEISFKIKTLSDYLDNHENISFEIKDTGRGMSKDFLEVIFEPFSREKLPIKDNTSGTGLGMAITKNLVNLMGGTITVKSRLGRGTTFTVVLPFEIAKGQENSFSAKNNEKKSEEISIAGINVLAAEDNELNAEILQELLDIEGVKTKIVSDGKLAFDEFKSANVGTYDAILLDIQMPNMDGNEAAECIRQISKNLEYDDKKREEAANIPIIAMTANAFSDDVQKSALSGMNAHIAKPIDMKKLKKSIYELLQNKDY